MYDSIYYGRLYKKLISVRFLQECIPKYKKFIAEHEKFDVEYDDFLKKIQSWKSQFLCGQPVANVDSLKV